MKLKSVDSTNRFLAKLFSESDKFNVPEGTTVIAEEQTAGEGMSGSGWESENGKNLLLSILLTPDFLSFEKIFLFSQTKIGRAHV